MAHERKLIRDAVVSALVAGNTAALSRVFPSRMAPLRTHELPALCVYTDSETVEVSTSAPRELTRNVTLVVEGWVKASERVEDELDDLALQVETVLDRSRYLNGTVADCTLRTTEMAIKLDGDRPMAVVHLEYEASYHTEDRLQPVVDNFDTMGVEYNMKGAQAPADSADDLVTGIYQGT